ncbi:hypothetical protein EV356DRAFT_505267 [Viridothelium virens]|uniref:Uncharacterized protein n=1 Tax=Viridothelium virens TaxID=1048519 RepID=A0A6A6H3P1_VIRVR|nr:hypothetical protein EV356DRAFT_505267 [Viridothelium virens]
MPLAFSHLRYPIPSLPLLHYHHQIPHEPSVLKQQSNIPSQARGGGDMSSGGFAARAQAGGARNENSGLTGGAGGRGASQGNQGNQGGN